MTIRPMGIMQWAILMLLSLLWGGSFFFMKYAVLELPVLSIVLIRVSLAAICLSVYLYIVGVKLPRSRQCWRLFFYLGLFNNVLPFSLLIFGMSEIASALAAILNATTPVFTILVAHVYSADEKITRHKMIGVLLGLAGVAVLVIGDSLNANYSLIAVFACLAAALSYAIAAMIGRKFVALKVAPSAIAMGQVSASSLLLVPLVLLIDKPWQLVTPSIETVSALLALGILSTALAYVLFFKLIATAGATNAVLVTLLVPVSAIALGILFLNESLKDQHLLGMAFIALGLLAIDGRLLQRLSNLYVPKKVDS